MKKIFPQFKNDTDKLCVVGMLILSMFLLFIPSLLIILFLKEYISETSYQITKAVFNMELLFFLVSLFFAVPIIGWLVGFILGPFLAIINVVFLILALCSISNEKEIRIPVLINFI